MQYRISRIIHSKVPTYYDQTTAETGARWKNPTRDIDVSREFYYVQVLKSYSLIQQFIDSINIYKSRATCFDSC